MKKVFLFFVLLLVSFPIFSQDVTQLQNFIGKVRVAIVDITIGWNSTGININVGDTVFIFVEGMAATNTADYEILWIGPEGMGGPDWIGGSGVPVPGASSHSVVGRLGDSGTPFYVGRKCSFIANTTGILQLGYNDFGLGDNFGYYVAFIAKASSLQTLAGNENSEPRVNNYSLSQNFPNPFNPLTSIQFSVPGASDVKLTIYDINGQKVRELINEFRSSGNYTENWDAIDDFGNKVSSGTYFYQVQIGNFIQTKKMIFLK